MVVHMTQHTCGGQDTVFRSWCITSTLWFQAIRLGGKGLYL